MSFGKRFLITCLIVMVVMGIEYIILPDILMIKAVAEYCMVNEPLMRKIKPPIAEDRATICGVESHKNIFSQYTSGILKGHAYKA
ncbi:hypothetical protein JI666_04030 [Bacillus sp. NTK071]|uniref:hypothetical protein n=1 Tax=Bacillus sp. NTK071 TaxID=2802175 RepID=UPI001A8D1619|nr:hypothetical protein [Bacillus sp. NTK071]MBN8207911.1 hypothetical protein [Bacillus sp. NTK071]